MCSHRGTWGYKPTHLGCKDITKVRTHAKESAWPTSHRPEYYDSGAESHNRRHEFVHMTEYTAELTKRAINTKAKAFPTLGRSTTIVVGTVGVSGLLTGTRLVWARKS